MGDTDRKFNGSRSGHIRFAPLNLGNAANGRDEAIVLPYAHTLSLGSRASEK
jgi:hypothetical protein